MFSGLGTKIAAFFASALGITLFLLSLVWKSNKKKQKEIDSFEKKDEIIDDSRLAEIQAEVKENEALKDTSDINWRDSI